MAVRPVPNFEAAYMAVARVERLLKKVTRALTRAGVPYAVVGGNAVAAWVSTVDPEAIRFTKDVDLLTSREALPAMAAALRKVGLDMIEVMGVTMFVDRKRPSPKSGVHIILANERIRPHYVHLAPDVSAAIQSGAGYSVIGLVELVVMKLQSFRDVDRTHIRDMEGVGLLNDALVAKLPPDLRKRLDQIRESPED